MLEHLSEELSGTFSAVPPEVALVRLLAALILPSPMSGTALVRWSVPAAILLLVVSSVDHAVRLRAYRQARAESEGGRLATYVKYLSELPKEEDGPGEDAPGIDDAFGSTFRNDHIE